MRYIVIIFSILLLCACSSSRKTSKTTIIDAKDIPIKEHRKPDRHNGDPKFDVDKNLSKKLVKEATKWIGTPYRYGGTSKKGTDCSGMTMSLFYEIAGVSLPRNSAKQCEYCVGIGREDLQPGDLIFFATSAGGTNIGHVGIYIGDSNMIHASASKGVISSNIDEAYWRRHYFGSGRVNAVTYAMTGKTPHNDQSNKPVLPELAVDQPENTSDQIRHDETITDEIAATRQDIEPVIEQPDEIVADMPTQPANNPPISEQQQIEQEINTIVEDAFRF